MTLAAPWKLEVALEAPRIKRYANRFAPKGEVWRICANHEGVCVLFKAHPLDSDPSESVAKLIAAAPSLRDAAQEALKAIERGDTQVAAEALSRALERIE